MKIQILTSQIKAEKIPTFLKQLELNQIIYKKIQISYN
jgi:hypothetical protein